MVFDHANRAFVNICLGLSGLGARRAWQCACCVAQSNARGRATSHSMLQCARAWGREILNDDGMTGHATQRNATQCKPTQGTDPKAGEKSCKVRSIQSQPAIGDDHNRNQGQNQMQDGEKSKHDGERGALFRVQLKGRGRNAPARRGRRLRGLVTAAIGAVGLPAGATRAVDSGTGVVGPASACAGEAGFSGFAAEVGLAGFRGFVKEVGFAGLTGLLMAAGLSGFRGECAVGDEMAAR